MAKKVIFIPDINNILLEPIIDFVYVKGMAFSQKQKCMCSLHEAIAESYPNKRILEVSTKSYYPIGVKLSAFNLTLNNYYVESVFQSSKVFEGNIQYSELIKAMPRDAKKYVSEHSDIPLIKFRYDNQDYPLIPKSMFYDFIYIQALCEHKELADQLLNYDIFTDIEFNEKRQVNCQARSCALYVYMKRKNLIDYYMSSIEHFKELYEGKKTLSSKQLSFFD